ncbi:MAG TPA: methyltransferase domain-containing protein [Bacteroidales bacterium]|nr:methyltransferase domain-containing protein [Bacteroidales bacterium]
MDEYKLMAPVYDPLLHMVMHRVRKKVVQIVENLKPEQIIDICCGTGNQLKYLKRHGFDNIIGVDLSQSMLFQAGKGSAGVSCEQMDASAMNFEDNRFNLGIISFALHEKPFAVARQIIKEAARIIQNEGHLIIVDYMFDGHARMSARAAIHMVERMAGKDHYRSFRQYVKNGGPDHLLADYLVEEEYRFHGQATGIRVYSMEKYGQYA